MNRRDFLMGTASALAILALNKAEARGFGFVDPNAPLPPWLILLDNTAVDGVGNITNKNLPALDFACDVRNPPIASDVLRLYDNSGATLVAAQSLNQTDATNGLTALGLGSGFSDGVHNFSGRHQRGVSTSQMGAILAVTVDTTAPTLTSPTGAQDVTNDSHAALGVTTNEANGLIYFIVCLAAASPPTTSAQMLAALDGSNAAAKSYGRLKVTTTGAKTMTAFGVNASGSYKAYFMHQDNAGNFSPIVGSSAWTQTPSTGFDIATKIAPDLWLDANDYLRLFSDIGGATQTITTKTSAGDYVGAWKDRSPTAFDLAASANIKTVRPTYQNAQFPCVRFDGVLNLLSRASPLGLGAAAHSGAGSIVCVAVRPTPAVNAVLLGEQSPGQAFFDPIASDPSNAAKWQFTARDDLGGLFANNLNMDSTAFNQQNPTLWQVMTFQDDGANWISRVNAVQQASIPHGGAINALTNTVFGLGGTVIGANHYMAVDVAAVVCKLSGSVSTTLIHQLETELGAKVGLSI